METDIWMILLVPVTMVLLPFFHVRASALTIWRGGIQWRNKFYPLAELRANQKVRFLDLFFARGKFKMMPEIQALPRIQFSLEGSDLLPGTPKREPGVMPVSFSDESRPAP